MTGRGWSGRAGTGCVACPPWYSALGRVGTGLVGLGQPGGRAGAGLVSVGRAGPGRGWAGARPRHPWVRVLVGAARWCTHQLSSRPRWMPVIEPNNDRLVAGGAGVCVRRGGRCTSQDPTAVPAMGAGRGDPRDSAVSPRRPPAATRLFCASYPGGGVGLPLRRPPADRHARAPARQPAPACRSTPATPSIGPFRPRSPVPVPGRAGRRRRQAPAPRRARRRRCTDHLTPPGTSRSGRVTPRRPEARAPAHGTLRQNRARCGELEVP